MLTEVQVKEDWGDEGGGIPVGGEKLRDDITCLALDLKNTELVQLKKKKKE